VIFLGSASFSNDDGSGSSNQNTLVRFEVEEAFKGIPAGSRQAWVDPGSFSSCYQEYTRGERYVIFATGPFPGDSAAVKVMRDSRGQRKPMPKGFDPASDAIYHAPLCSGSHRTRDFPNLDKQLAMLRAYRSGSPAPRILGHVYQFPFRGWPILSGPMLPGVRVTLSNKSARLEATTDADGNFSLKDATEGYYEATADLPTYQMRDHIYLYVPGIGCGYAEIKLWSGTALRGMVLDRKGRPAPKIPVHAEFKNPGSAGLYPETMWTVTDQNGQFTLTGLPDEDLFLSAGVKFPSTGLPYRQVYYPGSNSPQSAAVVRLRPGDRRMPVVVLLDEPLKQRAVDVQVVDRVGKPAAKAELYALDDQGVVAESASTNRNGLAKLLCLLGLRYQLEATALQPGQPWGENIKKSTRSGFACGEHNAPLKLVLDRGARD
jgi:hypothetical protein